MVQVRAWQRAYQSDFPEDFLEGLDVERRTRWFRGRIESGQGLIVAEVEGTAVGYCVFGRSDDEGWGEIQAIYVDPAHWGVGHGYRLLAAAEGRLLDAGLGRALLWVLESNTRARRFYERQGWSLGKPIRLESIGGVQVTEVRYDKALGE